MANIQKMLERAETHYYHWLIGDNPIRSDKPSYIINLDLGISIRFNFGEAFFSEYDEFYKGIADIQFLRGDRPEDEDELERILIDAYNFMAIVDRIEDGFGLEDIDKSIF